ncbi:MAG: Flp pilus assembly protein CpaB [Methylobacter sp.]|nr:Flp pilus assembly protein CpaB [Methylobacter sp.]MDP2099482.1 Flp pilus assembly protein CpaB [Methylobacter sp.]MDP2429722.1 Flp pilus assembly protein CpaB [Methylobacter sp.]MDP3054356.1 Flp pilus assembly protein CpaB [Methylobacter sp.]MDP3360996.1 Flp pilus assembly protein CpaB [Methylobacter sp.]
MNKRFIIMLSIALMLAFSAAWMANRWVLGKTVPDQAMSVVVAAVEIPFGVKLEESQVKVMAWPGNTTPKGAYSSKAQVVNKVTMNKFYPDEIITEKRISEYLGGSTLSALIAKDYRAVSVRVDDVVGVSGFILPGNKVDILATKKDRSANEANTRTLLQNIKVLAVDQEASQEKEKPAIVRAVTLELKPEQAEIMVQAMQEGTIQLSLRNPLDDTVDSAPLEVAAAPPQPPKPKPMVKRQPKKRSLKIIPWQ